MDVVIAGAAISAAIIWAAWKWRASLKKRENDRIVADIIAAAVNETYEGKVREWKLNQREGLTADQRAEARRYACDISEAAIFRAGLEPIPKIGLYGRIAKAVKDAKKG